MVTRSKPVTAKKSVARKSPVPAGKTAAKGAAKTSPAKKAPARTAPRARPATPDNGLRTFSIHAGDNASNRLVDQVSTHAANFHAGAMAASPSLASIDPETAARQYLRQALAQNPKATLSSPVPKGFAGAAPAAPDADFTRLGTETVPLTETRVVKFRQTMDSVPIYGSLVSVELDDDNKLVGMNTALGKPAGVSPIAKISPAAAAAAVKKHGGTKKDLDGVVPRLNYWFDQQASKWRLVFILEDVRIVGKSPAAKGVRMPRMMDYFVDAHSGAVVSEVPRTATMAAATETALDGLSHSRQFVVTTSGARKLLKDAALNVQTFDFKFKDPETQSSSLPGSPISNPPKWTGAAVSAHANAEAVATFLQTVLKRNNIDNKGGPMNSSVNCIAQSEAEPNRQWRNAFWDGNQMVYGQVLFDGKLMSIAVDLDVVAHEMFHGVTDSTARLEYANQSGALNESYSDIFGVIVANFSEPDVSRWNWKLGERLDTGGKPFRDMSNPPAFGQPEKMKNFQKLPNTANGDWGGVHTNSGIPNKAAYLVLTAKGADGKFVLTPTEVAAIFYLALTQRLSRTSQFADARSAAVNSALSLFRKLPLDTQRAKVGAVDDAFDWVGIAGTRAKIPTG